MQLSRTSRLVVGGLAPAFLNFVAPAQRPTAESSLIRIGTLTAGAELRVNGKVVGPLGSLRVLTVTDSTPLEMEIAAPGCISYRMFFVPRLGTTRMIGQQNLRCAGDTIAPTAPDCAWTAIRGDDAAHYLAGGICRYHLLAFEATQVILQQLLSPQRASSTTPHQRATAMLYLGAIRALLGQADTAQAYMEAAVEFEPSIVADPREFGTVERDALARAKDSLRKPPAIRRKLRLTSAKSG